MFKLALTTYQEHFLPTFKEWCRSLKRRQLGVSEVGSHAFSDGLNSVFNQIKFRILTSSSWVRLHFPLFQGFKLSSCENVLERSLLFPIEDALALMQHSRMQKFGWLFYALQKHTFFKEENSTNLEVYVFVTIWSGHDTVTQQFMVLSEN